MSTADHDPAAPLAAARAAAFGLVTAGVGVSGHAAFAGTALELRVVAVVAALSAVGAWLAGRAGLRFSAQVVLLALAATQLAVHGVCSATAPVVDPHGHAAAGGETAPLFGMLAVHALATLLGAVVVLTLEAHAWLAVSGAVERARSVASRVWHGSCCPARRVLLCGSSVALVAAIAERLTWSSTPLVCSPALGVRGPPAR